MNKYSNVPFLILALWLLLVLSAFRVTMMNIDMKIQDIHFNHIAYDFTSGVLSFFGFGDQKLDSSEKIRETLDHNGNLIGGSVYGNPNHQDKQVIDKENELLLIDHTVDAKPAEAEVSQKTDAQKQQIVSENTERKVKPKPEIKEKTKDEKNKIVYILQCGAYNDKNLAEKQKNKISSLGFSSYIKKAKSGKSGTVTWYRVLVGPFDSESQQSEVFERLNPLGYSCYKISYGGNK